jgi:phosphoglycerate kinase
VGKQIPDLSAEAVRTKLFQIDDLDLNGDRVLVRCDFNVPLRDGVITDDLRIRSAVPTVERLLELGARVTACSHLGRPKGRIVDELRLDPVARRLSEALHKDVVKVDDVAGDLAAEACASEAAVVLLENLRFEPGEESNDEAFADRLAALADAYVDDAFGAAHRAHASIVGVAQRLPSAAGLLLADEVHKLDRLMTAAEHPFVAVLGGVKVSDKIGVLENLLGKVDAICIGGAMAFTVLAAAGEPVGGSLVERDRLDEVAQVLERARAGGVEIVLPTDVVASSDLESGTGAEAVALTEIGGRMGADIGPGTCVLFENVIARARTLLWNGPMGVFEIDAYASGTRAVAVAAAEATRNGAYTVVGGGDSASALKQLGLAQEVSHLSTGGGAMLEFLEGRQLPGIAVLARNRAAL